ncbi:hypothetical protein HPE56_10620 [Maribacter sp. ANRC-HE7]|uniref:Uncharacterized protein n=1 Tax=Maribacter aquimaris TaxID=2737171 RepID=A0ABR7V4Z7_9FLAO|nr:hypothetical protein [Maribacter aquimaris]MBD0778247.1 hypothetical protein [Maribacter aquimaris]
MNTKSKQGPISFRGDKGKDIKFIEHKARKFFIPGYVLVSSEINGECVAVFACSWEQFKSRSFIIEVSNGILKQLGINKKTA